MGSSSRSAAAVFFVGELEVVRFADAAHRVESGAHFTLVSLRATRAPTAEMAGSFCTSVGQ